MSLNGKLIAAVAEIAVMLCLVGILRSGRWRLCYSFVAYCAAILALEIPYVWFGQWNWPLWLGKQAAFDAIKLCMCLELGLRVLEPFPAARRRASQWAFVAVWSMLASCVYVLRQPVFDGYLFAASELHARAVIASAWLIFLISAATSHYRLIVHPFHRGLLLAFGVYLAVFGILLRLMSLKGWLALEWLREVDPKAYLAFALFLSWLSWRREGPDENSYRIVMHELRERTA